MTDGRLRLRPWIRAIAAALGALGMWSASHGRLDASKLGLVVNLSQYAVSLTLIFGAVTGKGLSSLRSFKEAARRLVDGGESQI